MSGSHYLYTATGRRLPDPPRRTPSRSASALRMPTRRFDPERDTPGNTPRGSKGAAAPVPETRAVDLYRGYPADLEGERDPLVPYEEQQAATPLAIEDRKVKRETRAIKAGRPPVKQLENPEWQAPSRAIKDTPKRSQQTSRAASRTSSMYKASTASHSHYHTKPSNSNRDRIVKKRPVPPAEAYQPPLDAQPVSQELPPSPRYSRSPRHYDAEEQETMPSRVRRYSTRGAAAAEPEGARRSSVCSIGGTELLPSLPRLQGNRGTYNEDRGYRTIRRFIDHQPEANRAELEEMLAEYAGREDELCDALTEAYGDDFEIAKSAHPSTVQRRPSASTSASRPPPPKVDEGVEDSPRFAQTIVVLGSTADERTTAEVVAEAAGAEAEDDYEIIAKRSKPEAPERESAGDTSDNEQQQQHKKSDEDNDDDEGEDEDVDCAGYGGADGDDDLEDEPEAANHHRQQDDAAEL